MFHFGFKDPRKEHVYTRVYPALSRATAAESLSEMILIEWRVDRTLHENFIFKIAMSKLNAHRIFLLETEIK